MQEEKGYKGLSCQSLPGATASVAHHPGSTMRLQTIQGAYAVWTAGLGLSVEGLEVTNHTPCRIEASQQAMDTVWGHMQRSV